MIITCAEAALYLELNYWNDFIAIGPSYLWCLLTSLKKTKLGTTIATMTKRHKLFDELHMYLQQHLTSQQSAEMREEVKQKMKFQLMRPCAWLNSKVFF